MGALELVRDETGYEEYEELLCKRDQLYKEAESLLIAYTQEFGEKLTKNFELKVECIKKKKMIAYCQKQINRGLSINATQMQVMIEQEMELYYYELRKMMEENDRAKNAETVDEYRIRRAKKLYRRLAKKLHPDINKMTTQNEKLSELWARIVGAYHMSDVDALEDLETLVRKVLDELGQAGFEIAFTNIEDRIARLERQIAEILSTEPYTYQVILCDKEKTAAKHKELDEEHKEYEDYLKELSDTLNEVICTGGVSMVWKMN